MAALLFAPLLVTASHGPGSYALALEAVAADLAHGHSHDAVGSPSHDATDHEHQTLGVIEDRRQAVFDVAVADLRSEFRLQEGRQRDGPRRPPRG